MTTASVRAVPADNVCGLGRSGLGSGIPAGQKFLAAAAFPLRHSAPSAGGIGVRARLGPRAPTGPADTRRLIFHMKNENRPALTSG